MSNSSANSLLASNQINIENKYLLQMHQPGNDSHRKLGNQTSANQTNTSLANPSQLKLQQNVKFRHQLLVSTNPLQFAKTPQGPARPKDTLKNNKLQQFLDLKKETQQPSHQHQSMNSELAGDAHNLAAREDTERTEPRSHAEEPARKYSELQQKQIQSMQKPVSLLLKRKNQPEKPAAGDQ